MVTTGPSMHHSNLSQAAGCLAQGEALHVGSCSLKGHTQDEPFYTDYGLQSAPSRTPCQLPSTEILHSQSPGSNPMITSQRAPEDEEQVSEGMGWMLMMGSCTGIYEISTPAALHG
ncbi:unnamed protein product [Eretmochelys imbricata]